ncbi:MAG: MOSC domain-containing protein [Actinomycetota bacterium]|nr:MOSC domain-containing protein [Actinomycetota bacterium]
MARVAWLSIAPVKGLALMHPEEIELGPDGVDDNRRFCLVDEDGRRYGALRDGRLQAIHVAWDGRRLELRFPDGAVAAGEVEPGVELATDLYERELHGRVVEGPWAAALSRYVGRPLRLLEAEGPTRSVDRARGPVTMLSEASLAELARRAGVERVDGRRFRMLIGIDGGAPHEEDEWLGREVRVGDAVVRPLEQVARCAITTQDPDTGIRDFDTLREIVRYRGLRDGRHADFGVFGEVVRPGRVRVGDLVEPL